MSPPRLPPLRAIPARPLQALPSPPPAGPNHGPDRPGRHRRRRPHASRGSAAGQASASPALGDLPDVGRREGRFAGAPKRTPEVVNLERREALTDTALATLPALG